MKRLMHGCLLAMTLLGVLVAAAEGPDSGMPLEPGDLVFINVHRQPELSTTTQLDGNGNIELPYIGNVSIKGLSLEAAGERVTMGLKSILKNPRVTITRSTDAGVVPGGYMRTESMQTQVIPLDNAEAATLESALSGMSSAGGSVSFDPATNSVILTDEPAILQNMLSVIRELDQMTSQITQVLIESKIVEVETSAAKELGIRWFVQGDQATGGYTPAPRQDALLNSIRQFAGPNVNESLQNGGGNNGASLNRRFIDEDLFDRRLQVPVQIAAPGQMFFGYMNSGIDLGMMLDALVADDKAELLASPYIGTVNHRPASIRMIEEFPYAELTTAGFSSVETTRFLEIGIKMDVVPHVRRDPDGERYILVELTPEVSTAVGVSNGVPVRAVRSTESQRIVRDGQSLVIGGIVMADNHTVIQKLPGLGNLPIFGNLFKHKERSRTSRELMIFVTPTIHDRPEDIRWERSLELDGFGHNDAFLAALESRAEVRKD
jgi:type II secretory pathway component GspD/PulD (secretin)